MCIDFDRHHSGGSFFLYVNDFCYYRNCLYTHRYKFSSEKKKEKKTVKESQYIVSHPELGSDPLFGSDRESGCDKVPRPKLCVMVYPCLLPLVAEPCTKSTCDSLGLFPEEEPPLKNFFSLFLY